MRKKTPTRLVVEDRAIYREIWALQGFEVVSPNEIPSDKDYDHYIVSMHSDKKFDTVKELSLRGKVLFLQDVEDYYELLQIHRVGAYYVLPMSRFSLPHLFNRLERGELKDQATWTTEDWDNLFYIRFSNRVRKFWRVYLTRDVKFTNQEYKVARLIVAGATPEEIKVKAGLSHRKYSKTLAILKDAFRVDNTKNLKEILYCLGII